MNVLKGLRIKFWKPRSYICFVVQHGYHGKILYGTILLQRYQLFSVISFENFKLQTLTNIILNYYHYNSENHISRFIAIFYSLFIFIHFCYNICIPRDIKHSIFCSEYQYLLDRTLRQQVPSGTPLGVSTRVSNSDIKGILCLLVKCYLLLVQLFIGGITSWFIIIYRLFIIENFPL